MPLFDRYFTDDRLAEVTKKTATRGFLRSGLIGNPVAIQRQGKNYTAPTKESHERILSNVKLELRWLQDASTCAYCKRTFTRKENIGKMKCDWHPHDGISTAIYSCCKQPFNSRGCTPCDHSPVHNGTLPRWDEKNDTEVIPLAVAIELGIPSKLLTIKDHDKAVIKRCFY